LISAGPTQEAIDPVRFISNRSSGKMGYALAEAAQARGAQVVLVSGPTALPAPRAVEVVRVETAEEMTKALSTRLAWSTVVVMAAAVADFTPKHPATQKIKKQARTETTLDLERTSDILAVLSAQRTSQLLVGFAAETQDLVPHATEKLRSKGLDLIVANNVAMEGAGFGSDQNAAVLIDRDGTITDLSLRTKRRMADDVLDAASRLLRSSPLRRTTKPKREGA
jgi:phosphopantothenoylcysteine decarboxylase/phosphopantothenate--cysteine ligase